MTTILSPPPTPTPTHTPLTPHYRSPSSYKCLLYVPASSRLLTTKLSCTATSTSATVHGRVPPSPSAPLLNRSPLAYHPLRCLSQCTLFFVRPLSTDDHAPTTETDFFGFGTARLRIGRFWIGLFSADWYTYTC